MRQVEKRKFSCFCHTQLPTLCRLPFAAIVMLNFSNEKLKRSGKRTEFLRSKAIPMLSVRISLIVLGSRDHTLRYCRQTAASFVCPLANLRTE